MFRTETSELCCLKLGDSDKDWLRRGMRARRVTQPLDAAIIADAWSQEWIIRVDL